MTHMTVRFTPSGTKMISKRQEADRQFTKISRQQKGEKTTSVSRSITDANKTTQDLKTAGLRKQREAKEAGDAEAELKKVKP